MTQRKANDNITKKDRTSAKKTSDKVIRIAKASLNNLTATCLLQHLETVAARNVRAKPVE